MYSLRHDISAGLQNTAYMWHTFSIWNTIEWYEYAGFLVNPLSAKSEKWLTRLLPTNCLSVFDHFVGVMLIKLIFNSVLANVPILYLEEIPKNWPEIG